MEKNIPYTNVGGELSVVGLQRYIPIPTHGTNPTRVPKKECGPIGIARLLIMLHQKSKQDHRRVYKENTE